MKKIMITKNILTIRMAFSKAVIIVFVTAISIVFVTGVFNVTQAQEEEFILEKKFFKLIPL